MLKETFIELLSNYSKDNRLIDELWVEIKTSYSRKNRHYHNLNHLENLFIQLVEIKKEILHWDAILYALFYHDIVYNSLKSDNEEKSADLAEMRMNQISIPKEIVELTKSQILATKSHVLSKDIDSNYFTDADLSILGQSWEEYSTYYKHIRKEYSIYPDLIYNPGRKKVLNHFLAMPRIFKTDFFYDKYEVKAKENLMKELETF